MAENDASPWSEKLVVTGTGRSGTTLMMQILTAMGEDTGYRDHRQDIQVDAQAGLERPGTWELPPAQVRRLPKIIKDPRLCLHLGDMAARGDKPGHVILCFRPLGDVARSRFRANRPWFPDDKLPDLSKVHRHAWPRWATLENQERAMAEALGQLVAALIQYEIRHTVIAFPEVICDPNRLWRSLCGPMRPGTVAELLDWRTQGDLDRFTEAWNTCVDPDHVHFGRPSYWEIPTVQAKTMLQDGDWYALIDCPHCGEGHALKLIDESGEYNPRPGDDYGEHMAGCADRKRPFRYRVVIAG